MDWLKIVMSTSNVMGTHMGYFAKVCFMCFCMGIEKLKIWHALFEPVYAASSVVARFLLLALYLLVI